MQVFDPEDPIINRSGRAYALVYVTRGDLGENTVGVMLRQTARRLAQPTAEPVFAKIKTGLHLTLPTPRSCPPYVVTLDNRGGLFVQGRMVGRLK